MPPPQGRTPADDDGVRPELRGPGGQPGLPRGLQPLPQPDQVPAEEGGGGRDGGGGRAGVEPRAGVLPNGAGQQDALDQVRTRGRGGWNHYPTNIGTTRAATTWLCATGGN